MSGSHAHWADLVLLRSHWTMDRVLDTTFTSGKSTVVQMETKRKHATRYL